MSGYRFLDLFVVYLKKREHDAHGGSPPGLFARSPGAKRGPRPFASPSWPPGRLGRGSCAGSAGACLSWQAPVSRRDADQRSRHLGFAPSDRTAYARPKSAAGGSRCSRRRYPQVGLGDWPAMRRLVCRKGSLWLPEPCCILGRGEVLPEVLLLCQAPFGPALGGGTFVDGTRAFPEFHVVLPSPALKVRVRVRVEYLPQIMTTRPLI
jgi:hypothetical protein